MKMYGVSFNLRKEMESCKLIVLLLLIFRINSIDGRNIESSSVHDIMPPQPVVQCRTQCLVKYILDDGNSVDLFPNCDDDTNCAMCWDFCKTFHSQDRHFMKNICTDYTCVSLFQIFIQIKKALWESIVNRSLALKSKTFISVLRPISQFSKFISTCELNLL